MSKDALAKFRAQFADPKRDSGPREAYTNNYYPFWNMKSGQRAVIRFLRDTNESNPREFLVEKTTHTLTINGNKKSVPCLSMYGEPCPVCKTSQDYYKVDDKVNGKKYWRKKQYLAQALIVEDPLPPNQETGETHEGKVRLVALGHQIYNIIKEAYASEDDGLDSLPYDYETGYDFIIKKTEQGEYATYTMGSKFATRSRALDPSEIEAAEEGAVDLSTLLPKNPGFDKVNSMLLADLTGEEYTDDSAPTSRQAPTAAAPARPRPAAPAQEDQDDVPFQPSTPVASKAPAASDDGESDIDAMLAAIKARRSAAK